MDPIEKQLNALQGGGQIQSNTPAAVAPEIPAATPSIETPPADPAPAAPETPATTGTATPPAPETPETPDVPTDPMEAYVMGQTPKEVVLDDATKGILKSELGIEDLQAYKQQRATEVEEMTGLRAKAQRLESIEQNLGKLPLELEEAIADYLAGKEADPVARIKNMGVSVTVPSKDVKPVTLVNEYYKGKFSAEQLQEIEDGTASPELKDVFDKYHELAAGKHDDRGAKHVARTQEQQQAGSRALEAQERSAHASVAQFKQNKPLAAMVNDPRVIDDFISGKLLRDKFFNPDGTWKPDALERLVVPDIHKTLVEKVREGAFANGMAKGEAKSHAKQPDGPPSGPGRRVAPSAPPAKDPITEQLNQAQRGTLVGA